MEICEAPLKEQLKRACQRRRAERRIKLFTQLPDILLDDATKSDQSVWSIETLKEWGCDLDDIEEFCKKYELSYTRMDAAVFIWFDPVDTSEM